MLCYFTANVNVPILTTYVSLRPTNVITEAKLLEINYQVVS